MSLVAPNVPEKRAGSVGQLCYTGLGFLQEVSTEKEEDFRQTMLTCSFKSNFISWHYLAEIPCNGIEVNSYINVVDPKRNSFLT